MPIDYRLTQTATYQNYVETNSTTVLNYITTMPGSELSEIVTGTGINELIVKTVLEVLKYSYLVVSATNENGISEHWIAEDWVSLIKTNIQDARNWQDTHNNGLVSAMATDLSIPFAVAERLGWILEFEGTSKRTDVS